MGWDSSQNPGGLRGQARLARRLAALAGIVILIVGCGATPSPTILPSTTPLPSSFAQTSPGASPTATPAPSQSATSGAWTAVSPTKIAQAARLLPTLRSVDTIARTTSFVLTSLDDARPAGVLAARVVASPAVQFAVTESTTGAVLRPTAELAPDTRYRFSLTRPDGTVEQTWTARTSGPLEILETIPGDTATAVPLDAGIEFHFNQAGVTTETAAQYVSVSPKTIGHFETEGRSVAFVPEQLLAPATVYTVTVRRGLPLGTTGEALATDAVFRFETAAERSPNARLWFSLALSDASPREHAAIMIMSEVGDGESEPKTLPITVHQLGSLDAAMTAWRAVLAAPTWTVASHAEAVPTAGLRQVLAATVAIRTANDGEPWIQLPKALPVGWYVVTMTFAGIPRQLVLQITDTATYALVTVTQSVVWVNDLATGKPAVGATATLDGATVGAAADTNGLIKGATPASVRKASVVDPVLLVRYHDATTFRNLPTDGLCGGCGKDGGVSGDTVISHWWTTLSTDRGEYRRTDTINLVGMIRSRGTGQPPASVNLLLIATDPDGLDVTTPIETVSATPDKRGMYSASFRLQDLPVGGYRVRAMAGEDQIGEAWVDVATIRKPSYALTVTVNRHAVISGRSVRATVGAAFFEGTPVAGVNIGLVTDDPQGTSPAATLTTGTGGQGSATVRLNLSGDQMQVQGIAASPTLPEEAEIHRSAAVAVFAGDSFITIGGTVKGSTVRVTGSLNAVAWSRYEVPGADLWSVDPKGAPRSGATLRITPTASYTVVKRVGTEYDFITKRVVPKYEYLWRSITLPARLVTTAADGTFHLAFPTTRQAVEYMLKVSYTDAAGRKIQTTGWAYDDNGRPMNDVVSLSAPVGEERTYAVGDTVHVTLAGGAKPVGTPRYLFATLQQGLRSAVVRESRHFATTFTKGDVPSLDIVGVRFNGAGYDVVPSPYTAVIDPADRTLGITIVADKAHYEPGDTATITVRTTDPGGQPTAASVFVRAVDEKLYAMGAASDDDPVDGLYRALSNGIIGTVQSHVVPGYDGGGGGGDTGGGGGGGDTTGSRTDFRDWLIATTVQTDATGRATLQIPLSDDLTAWRVAATGIDGALNAGAVSAKIVVGLPFFADAVLAPEFLASDRPVLRVRSFGTQLSAGTKVAFTVSSTTLPMAATTVTADAFGSAYLPLPALSVGTHSVVISAAATVDGERLTDSMTRTFTVVASRATQLHTTWSLLTGTQHVQAGTAMTRVVLVDAGRGRVVPVLEELASGGSVRSDQELAGALANRVLTEDFGLAAVSATDPTGLAAYHLSDGLSIVPWGGTDIEVTALAAIADDPRIASSSLAMVLDEVGNSSDETLARQILALAGRAALGEQVDDLIAAGAARTDLSVEEQVNLALAALEAGNEELAGKLEQAILAAHGFQYGDQVRVDPVSDADATLVTARLAIVAASLGDPLAAGMDAYVAAHPSKSTLVVLERALAARGWAQRVASAAGSAAVTVDGVRKVVTLDAGQTSSLALTPAQAAAASIEPVSGSVLVVQTADAPLTADSLKAKTGVSVTRTVNPAGRIGPASTVVVTYTVELPNSELGVGWRLVDTVPSGLAPIAYFGGVDENGNVDPADSPDFMDGQRIEFSVGWDPARTHYTLRYVARVVSPGTYRWESPVLQSILDPAWGATVAPATITISTPGS